MIPWEKYYDYLGIKEFIYFISSPSIQDALFPIKLVFIFFTIFFFCAVIWFYVNSSYLQYQFLQDVTEFFSSRAYGLGEVTKRFKKIMKRTELGTEAEYKLAIIEADDFLYEVLEKKDLKGDTFEELLEGVEKRILPNKEEILAAHNVRNSIVYDSNYELDLEQARAILTQYESAISNISLN